MNEQDKANAEMLFSHISMVLTEHGKVFPTYIMIMDSQIIPVMVTQKAEMSLAEYESIVHQAATEMQPDAMILISEQWMISRAKDDPDIPLLVDGVMKPSDQPDKESYLTLIYTDKTGASESLIGKIESDPAGTRFVREQSWIDDCMSNMIRSWKIEEVK